MTHPHKPSRCAAGTGPARQPPVQQRLHTGRRARAALLGTQQTAALSQHRQPHLRIPSCTSPTTQAPHVDKRVQGVLADGSCRQVALAPAEQSGLVRITKIESARELDSSRADAGYASARSLTPHAEAGLARKASKGRPRDSRRKRPRLCTTCVAHSHPAVTTFIGHWMRIHIPHIAHQRHPQQR